MIEERREAGEIKTNVVHIEVPFGKPIEEVYYGVHDGPILGSGISGLVRLVTHRATGVKYAVKCLDLGLVETAEGLRQLFEEIFIMCQLDHPNIVRLEEVYESQSEIYLVQELCLGGELFDRLDEQPDYHYTEQQCARLIKQMLSAVRYIHSKGIVHRDLKLENFLFSTTSPDSEIKMIDFGLSKHFTHGQQHNEAVGTPYTVAPEVLRGKYDEKCDVWAIGVITYLLLSGDPPFGGCGGPEPLTVVRQNILRGSFRFEPQDIWENVSSQAKQFISSLLVTNPKTRPSAEEAQGSGWLQEWANNAMESNGGRSLNPNVVQALISFKEYSDMRKLLCEVLSFTLLPNQIEDLRKEFEKFDTEGRGEITLASLKQVLLHSAGSRSLGSLSEGEVEDIFNAMRIRKTDTTIQWHEFIAAGLSQCDYDDRNLRLAFDRLDSDHKGYISFDDVLDLMGSTGTEESIRAMFQDSLQVCRSKHARLSYDDFLHLMKGQTNEDLSIVKQSPVVHSPVISHRRGNSQVNVDEIFSLGESALSAGDGVTTTVASVPFMPILSSVPGTRVNQLAEDLLFHTSLEVVAEEYSSDQEERYPLENTPTPVTGSSAISVLSSPSQPITSDDKGRSPSAFLDTTRKVSPLLLKDIATIRGRSKSYDEHDSHGKEEDDDEAEKLKAEKLQVLSDSRRCILLPEHLQDNSLSEDMALRDTINVDSSNKSALVANRELYRAHRRMRLAVLEASKRFEENQTFRTKMKLEQANSDNEEASSAAKQSVAAGLTMRHGSVVRQDSNIIKELMEKREREREEQLQQAYKKAGRGKKKRHKTVSDMSAMMALASQPEPSKSTNQFVGDNDDAVANMNIANNAKSWTGPPPSMSAIHRYNSTPIDSSVPEETTSNIVMCYSDTDLQKKESCDTPENSP